jgi:hypothetical protein
MLTVILIGLYSILLLVIYGASFLAVANKVLKTGLTDPPGLLFCAFAGFIPLVWLTSLLSIFIPLDRLPAYLLLLGAICIFVWFWFRQRDWLIFWQKGFQKLHPLALLTGCLSILTIIVLATLKPNNADTGLYHAQAIRWIETYPAVIGLGNYHSRLAFNSNWFPLQAGFSFAFLQFRSFHLMGAVQTGLSSVYFTGGLQGLLRGERRFSNWMRSIFLPLVFFILASEISSTGTDLPVTLFSWVILCIWVEILENPAGQLDWQKILLFALPVCLVSIKLSAFPLLLISAWVLIPMLRRQFGWRRLLASFFFTLLFWAPWLTRNVIISGYLVYPPMGMDLFNVSWKIPPQAARDEADWITSWARISREDKDVILAMPVTEWAPRWFDELTINRQYIILALAAAPFVFGIIALAVFCFFRQKLKNWFHLFCITWPAWLVTYIGIVFWFMSVPRFRFGNGVIMAGIVLIVMGAVSLFRGIYKSIHRFAPPLMTILVSLYVAFVLATSIDIKTLSARILLPANYVNMPTAPCQFGNFSTACATQYDLCGYNPFPCTWQGIPNVYLRGTGFADGFEVH